MHLCDTKSIRSERIVQPNVIISDNFGQFFSGLLADNRARLSTRATWIRLPSNTAIPAGPTYKSNRQQSKVFQFVSVIQFNKIICVWQ